MSTLPRGVWCLRPASTRPRITDARRDAQCVSRLLRLIPGYIKAGGLKPPEQTPLQPDHSTTPSSQTSSPDPSSTGSERICGPHMAGPIPGYQFDGFPSWEYRPTMGGHPEGEKARCQHPGVMPAYQRLCVSPCLFVASFGVIAQVFGQSPPSS